MRVLLLANHYRPGPPGRSYWNVLRHHCLEGPAWRGVAAAVDAYRRRMRRLWERVDLFVAPSRYLRDRAVAGGLPPAGSRSGCWSPRATRLRWLPP